MNVRAFQIHPDDNVAVLIDDSGSGTVVLTGQVESRAIEAVETIKAGHKIALCAISSGQAVIKYGVRIGHITKPVQAGEWVHLHNCASDLDERSGTLDNDSGTPTDTVYE